MAAPIPKLHYRCPLCLAPLEGAGKELPRYVCGSCKKSFPLASGIPVFAVNPAYYYCPIPRNLLQPWVLEALESLKSPSEGKSRLLRRIANALPDNSRKVEWIDNLVDGSRAYFKLLIPGGPKRHVLNLGCGWDDTTIALAASCDRVTAMDLTLERAQVVAAKARYCNLRNVDVVCGGDGPHFPFPEASFDAVCVNGVLEWAAAATWQSDRSPCLSVWQRVARACRYLATVYSHHRPGEIQRAFLREVFRVLRPGGYLWLAIENRLNRRYFCCEPDDHSRLWFCSLYPRPLAHLASLIWNRAPYLTYTYSRRGYRKLLRRSGLEPQSWYAIEPEYRNPAWVVDIDNPESTEAFQRAAGGVVSRLPRCLYSSTAPSFGITAIKPGNPPEDTFLAGILNALRDSLVEDGHALGEYTLASFRVTRKEKATLLLHCRGGDLPDVVVKLPLSARAGRMARRHLAGVRRVLVGLSPPGGAAELSALLPRPIAQFDYGRQPVFVETCLPGSPLAQSKSARIDPRLLLAATRVIARLTAASGLSQNVAMHWQRRTAAKVQWLATVLRTDWDADSAVESLRALAGNLLSRAPSSSGFCLLKGDCTVSNVLVDSGIITGVVDFDEWQPVGLSLTGLAEFYLSYCRRIGISWAAMLGALARSDLDVLPTELPAPGTLLELDLSASALRYAAIEAWLNHVVFALRRPRIRLNAQWVRAVVLEVLDALASNGF